MILQSACIALISDAAATIVLPAFSAETTRRFAAPDPSKQRIVIINRPGNIVEEYKIGPLHDLHLLPSGNVLFQTSMTQLLSTPHSKRVFL